MSLVEMKNQFGNCPALAELQQRNQWVCWKREQRKNKDGSVNWTKPPYNPATGKYASIKESATWTSFPVAWQAYQNGGYDGIGFVFTEDDPYVGVDLDHVRNIDDGSIVGWAQQIIISLDSYTEISPSGDGFHILTKGDITRGGNHDDLPDATGGEDAVFEMYKTGRYFTFTLNTYHQQPLPINERSTLLESLCQKYLVNQTAASTPAIPATQTVSVNSVNQPHVWAGIDLVGRGVGPDVLAKINTSYPKGQRSEEGFSVICSLYRAGLNDVEITSIFKVAPIGERACEKGPQWFQQELERAKAKAVPQALTETWC